MSEQCPAEATPNLEGIAREWLARWVYTEADAYSNLAPVLVRLLEEVRGAPRPIEARSMAFCPYSVQGLSCRCAAPCPEPARACAHEDPLVLDGQTAWCPDCGGLYGMKRWRLVERRGEASPKDSSAPASPSGDVLIPASPATRGVTRDVATATAAQGPGSGDGGERPALRFCSYCGSSENVYRAEPGVWMCSESAPCTAAFEEEGQEAKAPVCVHGAWNFDGTCCTCGARRERARPGYDTNNPERPVPGLSDRDEVLRLSDVVLLRNCRIAELEMENACLHLALVAAATSLETASRWPRDELAEMKPWLMSRARVAREACTTSPSSSDPKETT